MLRPAFSTVACPDWTLERIAQAAAEFRFDGVELRTLGFGPTDLAGDPSLTDPAKTRELFASRGIEIACLGTSVRFDAPVFPPVLGYALPMRFAAVNEARRAVELASRMRCPFIRVFGFEVPKRENKRSALNRIAERLAMVCDHARHREVKVLIENGASYPGAADIAEIIATVNHPLLFASVDLASAHAIGEDPADAARILGDRIKLARIKDTDAGRPCPLGHGDLPCREFVTALSRADVDAWLVYTWDKAWLPDLAPPERILPEAAQKLWEWIAPAAHNHAAA